MSNASAGQRLIALLMELKVDVAFRLHQRRTADFGHGKRRGKGDHVVRWTRPPKPEWMDDETYARMPESIKVREVEVRVDRAHDTLWSKEPIYG